jgi:uncharacterized membrane protein YjjB (DUF3815 family)
LQSRGTVWADLSSRELTRILRGDFRGRHFTHVALMPRHQQVHPDQKLPSAGLEPVDAWSIRHFLAAARYRPRPRTHGRTVDTRRYVSLGFTGISLLVLMTLWVAGNERRATGSLIVLLILLAIAHGLGRHRHFDPTLATAALLAVVTGGLALTVIAKCVHQFFVPDGADALAVAGLVLALVLGSFCGLFVAGTYKLVRLDRSDSEVHEPRA